MQDITLGCKSSLFYNAPISFSTPIDMESIPEEPQVSRQVSLESEVAEEFFPRNKKRARLDDDRDDVPVAAAPRPKKLKLII